MILLIALPIVFSCTPKKEGADISTEQVKVVEYGNPPADGFDIEGSDPQAIVIADRVMQAMGGRKAWDDTRYLSWNFFGSRKLIWDKWEGRVRIDYLKEDLKIVVDIQNLKGTVLKEGKMISNSDSLVKYLTKGRNAWINDSYWLVMPFKLKDTGVTLSYLREDTTQNGTSSYVLELTFKDVGVTPENYYEIWVDTESNLVSQWAFFETHGAFEPRFVNPWGGYQLYGNIKLSGDRGELKLTDIEVLESVPEDTFKLIEKNNL